MADPKHGSQVSGTHPHGHHSYQHHHHHHHINRHRIPSGTEEQEEEDLDPRIQVELERLNKASEEINKLELELDDTRAGFRQVLSDSTQCLNGLAKKLGACVDKARPYYDGRMRLKEAHVESQKAALRFERACSMHEAAKEMVQLAEEGYKRREEDLDPTWQEMLNHATMKVNDAETERIESEAYHQHTTMSFKKREEEVQKLQKDLKRSITKSRPYFEMKAKFNQVMEDQKSTVSRLEDCVVQAKALYSQALRNLEAISDDIHRTRLERRQNMELGERGAGVGSEAPSPPPSWDKGVNIEGSASSCAYDSDTEDDPAHAMHRLKLDGLETDPLNVAVFTTEPPTHLPSIVRTSADRARSDSYRAAISRRDCTDSDERDIKPHQEDNDTLVTPDLTPTGESGEICAKPEVHSSLSSPHARESSLSRAQEWVNRSPIPHQRRFVKSKSLVNAAASSGWTEEEGDVDDKEEGVQEYLSSSLTTTAIRAMRASQGYDMYPSSKDMKPLTVNVSHQIDSAHVASPHHLKSGSQGSVRSLGSTPPDSTGSESPRSHRKSPKLQGLILKVDPSGSPASSIGKPSSAPVESTNAQSLPRVVISTQHPTLGLFTQDQRETSPQQAETSKSTASPQPAETSPASSLPQLSSSSSSSLSHQTPQASLPNIPSTEPSKPRHPTSLITQQLNKMIQAVNAATAPTQTSAPPSTLMGTSYRLHSSAQPAASQPVVSPTPVVSSPSPGDLRGRSDSMSTVGSGSLQSRNLHLKPPSDSSDTESIASTGPMLDDDQVELINLDFNEQSIAVATEVEEDDYSYPPIDPEVVNPRGHWSRMSLPPRLNYLDGFLERARKLSGEQSGQVKQEYPVKGVNGENDSKGTGMKVNTLGNFEGGLDSNQDISETVGCSEADDDKENGFNTDGSTSVAATVVITPDNDMHVVAEDSQEQLYTEENHYA